MRLTSSSPALTASVYEAKPWGSECSRWFGSIFVYFDTSTKLSASKLRTSLVKRESRCLRCAVHAIRLRISLRFVRSIGVVLLFCQGLFGQVSSPGTGLWANRFWDCHVGHDVASSQWLFSIDFSTALRFARNDPAPNYPALIRREFALNLCGTRRQWPILRLHSGQVSCGAGIIASSCRQRLNKNPLKRADARSGRSLLKKSCKSSFPHYNTRLVVRDVARDM